MTGRDGGARLAGRVMVVTGATSGIGYETALGLARLGATVIGVGRARGRCDAAAETIRRETGSDAVRFEVANLASQGEIRALAGRLRSGLDRLDVLVNNAGAFTGRRELSPDGVEMQLAVNLLAPFLLTRELLPLLGASRDGRLITVSSGTHFGAKLEWIDFEGRRRYRGLRTYGATKLAAVLWSYELARRLGPGSAVSTFAADPGLVNTDMGLKDTHPLVRLVWAVRRRHPGRGGEHEHLPGFRSGSPAGDREILEGRARDPLVRRIVRPGDGPPALGDVREDLRRRDAVVLATPSAATAW